MRQRLDQKLIIMILPGECFWNISFRKSSMGEGLVSWHQVIDWLILHSFIHSSLPLFLNLVLVNMSLGSFIRCNEICRWPWGNEWKRCCLRSHQTGEAGAPSRLRVRGKNLGRTHTHTPDDWEVLQDCVMLPYNKVELAHFFSGLSGRVDTRFFKKQHNR